jgi:hypothetical protein
MSMRLDAYLTLERVMVALDAAVDPLADTLRDMMDPLWLSLTDEEHQFLDARALSSPATLAAVIPVRRSFFVQRRPSPTIERVRRDCLIGVQFELCGRAT